MQKKLTYEEIRKQLPEGFEKTADMEINLTENIFFDGCISKDEFELLEKVKQIWTKIK